MKNRNGKVARRKGRVKVMVTWTRKGGECAFGSGMSDVVKPSNSTEEGLGSAGNIYEGGADSQEGSQSGKNLYRKIEV
jgi:hypothetical protein